MLTKLRQNPHSLYGKVQLMPLFVWGPVALALAIYYAGLESVAVLLTMGGNGLLLAGLVPWWVLDKSKVAEPRPRHVLAPAITLKRSASLGLLAAAVTLGALSMVLVVIDGNEFTGAAVMLLTMYLSPYLPVWRSWPI